MSRFRLLSGTAAVLVGGALIHSYASRAPQSFEAAAPQRLKPAMRAPIDAPQGKKAGKINGRGTIRYTAEGPSAIELRDVPREAAGAATDLPVRGGKRIESRFSDEQVAAAVAAAKAQKKSAFVQNFDGSQKPVGPKIKLSSEFDAIDAGDCCQGTRFSAYVPPDPDLAVGPDHVIVVVNTAFEVFDKQGRSLTGPIQFATFFDPTQGGSNTNPGSPTPGCTAFTLQFSAQRSAVFDPDVVYDEAEDRFVIGIDGNGDSYCVAASQTGDPTGAWYRYGFPTDVNGAFFDFPHMGVGVDAIYMGSNQFGGSLPYGFEGRVFAMDKGAMYNGAPLPVVTRELAAAGKEGPLNIKLDGTPQPAHIQGAFPSGGPHYIMGEFFDGKSHAVYGWTAPFGANAFDLVGDVDLAAASGVACEGFSCFPVDWPQKGSVEIITANDYRGQETKQRDGRLWTTQTVSCNPGKGTRNCVRWAEIDPTEVEPGNLAPGGFPLVSGTSGVVQAGVFGSDWGYRTFPSIAVNACGDMAVGYSFSAAPANSGGTWYPSVYVNGRAVGDPSGKVGGERLLKKAEVPYSSFQDNGGQFGERWGDYSGMASDPDGKTFWYVGEYARPNTPNPFANWGTYVGSFRFNSCD
jgi:hypothetical protein